MGPAVTRSGALLGPPGYLAPEQASSGATVDARTDVFALGCVLFAAVTGRAAFRGENVMAVLAKILFEEPPRLREYRADSPAWLDCLVERMLAKDPARRPRDGRTVGRELGATAIDITLDASTESSRAASSLTRAEQRYASVLVASGEPTNRADIAAPTSRIGRSLRGLFGRMRFVRRAPGSG